MSEAVERKAEVTKRRVGALLGRRRQNLDRDSHITDYDRIEDGHKVDKRTAPGPRDQTNKVDRDLTALYGAAPSTTTDPDLLVVSARIAAEKGPTDNPHVPATDQVLDDALERMEREGLTPAWELVDGEGGQG
ncbi:hypothetical protein [Natronorarus salvus]|uniref:hypothetical protein n=1 Tax=Natronorarus salvus TaxID=3117733 RepID=UPI002F2686F4